MEDEKYMRRCIQLAYNGLCNTAPNPMVGAVIVHNGQIIGEGYHVRCGQAHAEVNAIRSVKNPDLLKESTIYVSLEPCAHYGKTPPCADLIIEKQIPRIVIGCQDPFAKVAGKGIQKLRDAGREVIVGVLEEECLQLNRRFITFHTRKRPFITLKWAESADGFIDRLRTEGTPTILSSPLTGMLVHKLRTEHAAILIGTDTARLDNPRLNVRHWYGSTPVRITIDRHHRLSQDLNLFDGSQPTLVYVKENLSEILKDLYERQLQSLLVEGGRQLLQSFINAGLWDEIIVEETSLILGEGVKAPQLSPQNIYRRECHFGRGYRHYFAQEKHLTGTGSPTRQGL